MQLRRALLIALVVAAWPGVAMAQTPAPVPPAPPAAPTLPISPAPQPMSHLWIVIGPGFTTARAGCPSCDPDGIYAKSASVLIDAGVGITPRIDAGIELLWAELKVDGGTPIRTTFILGVAQFHPWVDRGLFLRAGMGIGVVGNGLFSPIGPPLAPPYTTNALGIVYGVGWEFAKHRRWNLQAHAMHHVAALGELTTVSGDSIKNVVGNYWTVGVAFVIR
jgi:hypothetical protein